MPTVESAYQAPWLLRHPDAQTILPTLIRKLPKPPYQREWLQTSDGDELALDWWLHSSTAATTAQASEVQGRPLAILAHGMEGSSDAWYIRGLGLALVRRGFDVLAWNMRGCGGRPNHKSHFYHSGKTEDLREIIVHARKTHPRYVLAGFSLGGNLVLKHMGEVGRESRAQACERQSLAEIPAGLLGAAVISVPVDLAGCATRLSERRNFIYQNRFLRLFHAKLRAKMQAYPGLVSDAGFSSLRDLRDFDNRYTAPDFGYANAEAYWEANASKGFLADIAKPTLLLTSGDDPFMSPACYPRKCAASHRHLTLEVTRQGGHCGFMRLPITGENYAESRAADYLEQLLKPA